MATNNKPTQQSAPTSAPAADPTPSSTDGGVFVTLTKDDLLELIREARKDPRREAELEAEGLRVATRRKQMIRIARADEASKVARQRLCGHRKPNGEECSSGQEFSDGRVRIFCLRCQKVLRDYWSQSVAQGMAIQSKMEELGVTADDVKRAGGVGGVSVSSTDLRDLDPDDFALSMPRGVQHPGSVLTTDNQNR